MYTTHTNSELVFGAHLLTEMFLNPWTASYLEHPVHSLRVMESLLHALSEQLSTVGTLFDQV